MKQTLLDTRHDWNLLGGSRCSYSKHLCVLERRKRLRGETEALSIQQNHNQEDTKSAKVNSFFGRSLRGTGKAALQFTSLAIHSSLVIEQYIEKALAPPF